MNVAVAMTFYVAADPILGHRTGLRYRYCDHPRPQDELISIVVTLICVKR
jgi:hypothetical protein